MQNVMPTVEECEHLDPRKFNQPVDVVLRHVRRYLTAVELLGRTGESESWLDYGSGSGYGTDLLNNFAVYVDDFDQQEYPLGTLNRRNHYVAHASSFNAVFCIEVIEHISDGEAMLIELKHYCRPGGDIIVTTPIVPQTNHSPTNPHHKIEYSLQDFCQLVDLAGLHIVRSKIEETTFTDGETKGQGYFVLKVKEGSNER